MSKQFTPDSMAEIRYLSWPAVSADGQLIAFVLRQGQEDGSFPPVVRVLEKVTGRYVYETPADRHEMQPLFLRDGRLALLSDASGEYQLWLRDLTTGDAQQLTHLRHGLIRYRIAQDMTRVVFEATLYPGEADSGAAFTEMTAEEKAAWLEELDYTPYEATDLIDKMDEWYGMRKGEKSHIGVCGLDGGSAAILNLNGMEAVYPAISADGAQLCFYGMPYQGARGYDHELFVCASDGTGLRQLTEKGMLAGSGTPVFTPEGDAVMVLAYHVSEGGGLAFLPYRVPLDGSGAVPALDTGDESVCQGAGETVVGRAENGENDNILFIAGDRLWFQGSYMGHNNLFSVSLQDVKDVRLEQEGQSDIQSFGMNAEGVLAVMQGTVRQPAELYADGRPLTDENAWLRAYAQGKLEEKWITSRDGKARLHYWLLHPVQEEPGKRYPAVLDVHGGPTVTYGASWWHEFHALSAAGFAVIYGDPRGSVGYGRDFGKGGICWKQEAMDDLMDMCDDAVASGLVDAKRIGITGGSYGGYMVVKMIGSNDYFACAVAQRALINLATSYGTGDMGFVSAGKGIGKDFTMLQYLSDRARNSNIRRVDSIKVPTLILHASHDYRCTFEQAEQLFIAMRERRPEVPVRLVRFPGGNHGLTRTGKLYHQIRHLQEMVDWFSKYLHKEGEEHA
ncbi:MAG: prolyl oligopeptidase family serine peptidase [Aristaeellaceae bacterium]